MSLRSLLLPGGLAVLLLLAVAAPAHAGPTTVLVPHPGAHFHGGFGIGIGASIPLHGPRRHWRGPGQGPCHGCGHWAIHHERVWVPGPVIGYESCGHPVRAPGHWTVRRARVWVPARRPLPLRPRPVGRFAIGVRY